MAQTGLGLALGGGFLRGAAHVGVLKVLEAAGIKPALVAGTSAGSIVAALYAAGWPVRKIEALTLSLKASDVYDQWSSPGNLLLLAGSLVTGLLRLPWPLRKPLGLMKGKNLDAFLKKHLQDRRPEDMRMTLAITAVDVQCGSKVIFMREPAEKLDNVQPDEVYLRDFKVADAVLASTAVPGMFEPRRLQGCLLVDGGLREQVPAEVLQKLGAEVVVAVDVGYDDACARIDNIVQVLTQTLDIIREDAVKRELDACADLVIRPRLTGIGPFNFDRIPYAIKQGELAAQAMLPEIQKVMAAKFVARGNWERSGYGAEDDHQPLRPARGAVRNGKVGGSPGPGQAPDAGPGADSGDQGDRREAQPAR